MLESVRKIALFFVIMLVPVLFSGCATLADARRSEGSGPFRIYDAPAEKVWTALPQVIKNSDLQYVGENRQEGYILAQRGITMFSYGEEVAIFIKPLGEHKTRVEIVSKKALATNIFAPDWSNKLFQLLGECFPESKEK